MKSIIICLIVCLVSVNINAYRKSDASSVITGLGNQLGLSSSLVSQIIGQYNSLNSAQQNQISNWYNHCLNGKASPNAVSETESESNLVIEGLARQLGLDSSLTSQLKAEYNALSQAQKNTIAVWYSQCRSYRKRHF